MWFGSKSSSDVPPAVAKDVVGPVVADLGKRRATLENLLRVVRGEIPCFNSVLLQPADLLLSAPSQQLAARSRAWFMLALSVGRMLASLGAPEQADVLLRASCQLMAEYEHSAGDTIIPDSILAFAAARGTEDVYPDTVRVRPTEPIKPTLHTCKGAVVYECLVATLPVPFDSLDYAEVCITLLEALETLFSKLVSAHGFASIPTVRARESEREPFELMLGAQRLSAHRQRISRWESPNPCLRLTSLPARSAHFLFRDVTVVGALQLQEAAAKLDRRVKHYVVKPLFADLVRISELLVHRHLAPVTDAARPVTAKP